MTENLNPELEHFRNQWREEVTKRSKGDRSTGKRKTSTVGSQPLATTSSRPLQSNAPPSTAFKARDEEEEDSLSQEGYHDLEDKDESRRLGQDAEGVYPNILPEEEPRSALEHFERAIEKEDQGSLGDSLSHYRQAYRLDAGVDKVYRNKHFPPASTTSRPSNAAVTILNPAHHSLNGSPRPALSELIASFSTLSIPSSLPSTEHSPAPPCPIASIPSEVLIEILYRTALLDVASYSRLSRVCKRLAYLVATEDQIWREVCLGKEVGFPAMHYTYATTIEGTPIDNTTLDPTPDDLSNPKYYEFPQTPITYPVTLTPAYPTYATMFRTRPRIRFNGCYISTVNYIRPGASSPMQTTWNSPVHIVTYYRYLRFFRDGTCVSLLTTTEPVDVVHHLTKEHIHDRHTGGSALPSSVMKTAQRGRWKLSPPLVGASPGEKGEQVPPLVPLAEPEGNVYIETEGVDIKYMNSMQLALRSGSNRAGATRNNKLVWRGYWNYNRLTDDWAEFRLRNDRPYFWSRVKSYGMGY